MNPMPSCEFIKPGLYTSLQDQGRLGMSYYAIPPSGVMDRQSANLANVIIGNLGSNPVIECCLSGPTIKFHNPTTIAITGSPMAWAINGKATPLNTALIIKEGDILSSKFATAHLYAYIAIQGDIETTLSYDSCSVYPPAKLGHQGGKPFQKDDIIKWKKSSIELKSSKVNPRVFASNIPIIKGPEYHLLTDESKQNLTSATWAKSVNSNRMGARLSGPSLTTQDNLQDSVPVLPGHIQLPPSGLPIVVLRDGQTTGGYPRIGFIDRDGLDDFNQVGLREELKFTF